MKRTLISVMVAAAAVLLLAGCGHGSGGAVGSEGTSTVKDEAPDYTFLEEDSITLEDGRTLTCITTSRSSGGVSCDWDNAKDGF